MTTTWVKFCHTSLRRWLSKNTSYSSTSPPLQLLLPRIVIGRAEPSCQGYEAVAFLAKVFKQLLLLRESSDRHFSTEFATRSLSAKIYTRVGGGDCCHAVPSRRSKCNATPYFFFCTRDAFLQRGLFFAGEQFMIFELQ